MGTRRVHGLYLKDVQSFQNVLLKNVKVKVQRKHMIVRSSSSLALSCDSQEDNGEDRSLCPIKHKLKGVESHLPILVIRK